MKSVLLPLAALAASPALATDARIATRFYDPGTIVTVAAKPGIQSTIEFNDDERVENIAIGDSAAWQVTPNKRASLVFVKPMSSPARTNMTVVTDRRTYLFDLTTSPKGGAVYVLRFTYPKPPAPPPVALAAATPAPVAPPPTPADLNFAWVTAGAATLLPRRLFDDGKSTWLAWDKEATLPAILVRDAAGAEGPVNYTVKGDYIVVEGVPAQLVLREGKAMATLTPQVRPAAGAAPAIPTRTASAK